MRIFLIVASFLCPIFACAQEADSARIEFHDFLKATLSPGTIAQPGIAAGWSQFVSRPEGFGGGVEAYGYRYGVSLANSVNGAFFRKFAFPVVFGERDLYRPSGSGGFLMRAGHATLHSFLQDTGGAGRERVNMSGVPASAVLAFLSNAYEPREQRTAQATLTRVGTNSLGYFASDFVAEFGLVCKARKVLHLGCNR